MRREILYFGSFNPVHRGHIALAEWVVEQGLGDDVVLIVSPQNPFKNPEDLAPELARFEMCEAACAASKYPDRIKPSVIEFLLEKPSYTINTLRYLKQNFGSGMEFSILVGADHRERFGQWRDSEEILRDYPILVYPRTGYEVGEWASKVEYLADAPRFDCASTGIRKAIATGRPVGEMVCPEVEEYIRKNGLWKK